MRGAIRYSPSPAYSTNVINLGDSSMSSALPAHSVATMHTLHHDSDIMSKKRKIDRACDACRRKKTKCDGPKMPDNICSNCIQNRKSCTYVEASKPRGPSKAYVTGLEDKLEKMEDLLQRIRPRTDFSAELGPPVIRGSWRDDHPANPKFSAASTKLHSHLPTGYTLPPHPNSQSSSAVHAANPAKTQASTCLNLQPWPNNRSSCSSQPPIGLSTHLLSHRCPRVRSGRRTQIATERYREDPDQDIEYSSSSDDDATAELSITRGMRRLTLRGLEAVDKPEETWVDSQMRFYGKSSLLELIKETRKLKEIHEGKVREAERERTMPRADQQMHLGSHERPIRRAEFWTTRPWEQLWEGLQVNRSDFPSMKADFPPLDLARDLFDLYFLHINTYFPLLHRPTLERQWREGLQYHDPWFACLCHSLFAAASRWSNDERVLEDSVPSDDFSEPKGEERMEEGKWYCAGWKWFNAAFDTHKVRRSIMHPPCLFEVQTFPLLSIFLKGIHAHQSTAWTFISIGLRKAQDVGAHRKKVYSSRPTVEEELWKRAFWVMVGFDRVGSAGLGRSCCAGEEDFDVDLPLEVDDEYWETEDPAGSFSQPHGKPALVAAFNSWLHLTQILGFALRTLYAIKSKALLGTVAPQWKEEVVTQLNTAMAEWVDSVPDHLKYSDTMDNIIFFNQSAMLYTAYYLNHIMIYRPFMSFKTPSRSRTSSSHPPERQQPQNVSLSYPEFPFPAISICVNAARSCARIIMTQRARGFSNVPSIVVAAHTSAMVLTMHMWDLRSRAKVKKEEGDGWGTEETEVDLEVDSLLDDVTVFVESLDWAAMKWEKALHALRSIKGTLDNASPKSSSPQSQHSPIPPRDGRQSRDSGLRIYERPPPAPSISSYPSSSPQLSSSHCSTPEGPPHAQPTIQSTGANTITSWVSYPAFQPMAFPLPPYPLSPQFAHLPPPIQYPPYYQVPQAPSPPQSQLQPPAHVHAQAQVQAQAHAPWTEQQQQPSPDRLAYSVPDTTWASTPTPSHSIRTSWPSVDTERPLPPISLTRRMSMSTMAGSEREILRCSDGCPPGCVGGHQEEMGQRQTQVYWPPEVNRWDVDRTDQRYGAEFGPRPGNRQAGSSVYPPAPQQPSRNEYTPGPSYTARSY